jgi:hypothetical protein
MTHYILMLVLSGFTMQQDMNTLDGCLKQGQILAAQVKNPERIIGVICTRAGEVSQP